MNLNCKNTSIEKAREIIFFCIFNLKSRDFDSEVSILFTNTKIIAIKIKHTEEIIFFLEYYKFGFGYNNIES